MSDATIVDYTWLVSDFSDLPKGLFSSSKFRFESNTFCLELYPSGKPPQRDVVSVFLRREEDFGVKMIGVKFRISIMCNKEYYKSQTSANAFGCLDYWGFHKLIDRCELLDKKYSLLPDNILTIRCEILRHEKTGSAVASLKERMAATLSSDLAYVLKSGEYSDMVIIAEGKKFNVHKVILKSRCPHLIKFLQKTERPNEYSILNIKASDFHEILNYLYTGLSNVKNVNKELLDTLKKFHVSDLSHSLCPGKKILARSKLVTSKMSFRWLIQDFRELRDGQEVTFPAYCYTESDWSKIEIVFMTHKRVFTYNYVYLNFKKLQQNQEFYMTCKIKLCGDTRVSISQDYEGNFKHNEWIVHFLFEDRHLFYNNLELEFDLQMSKLVTTQSKEVINVNTKMQTGDLIANQNQLQNDLAHLYCTTCVIPPDYKEGDYENGKSGRYEDCDSDDEEAVSKNSNSGECEFAEKNDGDEHENLSDESVQEAGDSDLNWDDSDVNCNDTITLYVGENAVPAHKVFLGARLKEISDLEVSDEKWVLNIEGLSTSTVSFLLRYIYSGRVSDLDVEETLNLYAAARKCKLSLLEEWCMHFLSESLDSLHVGEILLFADEHKVPHLKKKVFNYIAENPEVARKSESLAEALKSKTGLLQEGYEGILMSISKKKFPPAV